jgi:hypothetical protein
MNDPYMLDFANVSSSSSRIMSLFAEEGVSCSRSSCVEISWEEDTHQ